MAPGEFGRDKVRKTLVLLLSRWIKYPSPRSSASSLPFSHNPLQTHSLNHLCQIHVASSNMRFTPVLILAAATSVFAQDLSDILDAATSYLSDLTADPTFASEYSSLTAALATDTSLSNYYESLLSDYTAAASSYASEYGSIYSSYLSETGSLGSAAGSILSSATATGSAAAGSSASAAASAASTDGSDSSSSSTGAADSLRLAGSALLGAGVLGVAVLL